MTQLSFLIRSYFCPEIVDNLKTLTQQIQKANCAGPYLPIIRIYIDVIKCDHPLNTDLLHEAIINAVKKNPLRLFYILYLGLKSKVALKKYLLPYLGKDDFNVLPLNTEVVEYCRDRKSHNEKIYLVTGSHLEWAKSIAERFDFFDGIFGTTDEVNLKGKAKAKFLVEKFGEKNFEYIGDNPADLNIWKVADAAIVVSSAKHLINKVKAITTLKKHIKVSRNNIKSYIKALRIKQWAKNLLVLAPFLLAHNFNDPVMWMNSIMAFFAFSFCASSVYIINDIVDLENDRSHYRKKNRPLANGSLGIPQGLFLWLVLLTSSAVISFQLLPLFKFVILSYLVITFLYTFYFKNISQIDVYVLAILFSIRLISGAVATGVEISAWLGAFSLFVFLSLAYLKRYCELHASIKSNKGKLKGRMYYAEDIHSLHSFGTGSSIASVVVLCLYINQPNISSLYSRPVFLWGACVVILFWLNNIWLRASRGQVHDDPVLFAIKDKISLFAGLLVVGFGLLSL